MDFTPKMKLGSAIFGILTIAAVGLLGWDGQAIPASTPLVAVMAQAPAPRHAVRPNQYQSTSRNYNSSHHHHSWKKSTAIIGGSAAGGALIGGLAGGGKGALFGGLIGGGGGYLYNRYGRHHHHRH